MLAPPLDGPYNRLVWSLKLASEPARLQVLLALAGGERSHEDLCREAGLGQQAVSQLLMLLRAGGLVESRRERQRTVHRLTAEGQRLVAAVRGLVER